MVIPKQYPHKLIATIATSATQDADGNWVPGSTESREIECRSEPNGAGRMIQLVDGSSVVYSSMVYMPRGTEPLPDQTAVSITWDGALVSSGKVLRFSKGQLNSRIWLA